MTKQVVVIVSVEERLYSIWRHQKIRIDLLVKNSVVHNFLRIPQNTFPMLRSTVQMESSRSSTQTIKTTCFVIV